MNKNCQLTEQEAIELINMLKMYVANKNGKILTIPNLGKKIEFEVIGKESKDRFTVNINRNSINKYKYTYQGRTTLDNNLLLRLDVGNNLVHMNPNGEKIKGSHLHIYKEGYEISYAIEFNVNDKDLVENCIKFFREFNILTDSCEIIYQEEF